MMDALPILAQAVTAAHDVSIHEPTGVGYWFSFGLGVAVMAVGLYWMAGRLKESRDREDKLQENMLGLTRESLTTVTNLTKVVEAITPALSANSRETKTQLDGITSNLKEHISNHFELLAQLLRKREESRERN